jgi:Aldehyde dehydrogenase family
MAISAAVPVTDKLADALIERLVPKIEALKIGPTADRSSDMGPLVTVQHLAKVRAYIDPGEAQGAKIVVDGRTFKMDRQGYKNGYYIGGPLIDEVTPDMTIWKEEIFGPVLSIVRRKSFSAKVSVSPSIVQSAGDIGCVPSRCREHRLPWAPLDQEPSRRGAPQVSFRRAASADIDNYCWKGLPRRQPDSDCREIPVAHRFDDLSHRKNSRGIGLACALVGEREARANAAMALHCLK